MPASEAVVLPDTARPSKYRIKLQPDLHDFTFKGEQSVDLQILKPTSTIVLNAVELIILDERSFRDDDVADACIAEGEDEPDLLPALGAADVPAPYRSFRDFLGLPADTDPACLEALNDPSRTFLGQTQKEFLFKALEESEATFKFIVNEVAISELVFLPYDRWEGYRAERDEVLRFIQERGISNVIFLTTDIHANIISDVRVDLDSPPVAVEVITGPIAHTTLATDIVSLVTGFIDVSPDEAVGLFETLLDLVPQVDCVAAGAFSYGLVEVDPVTAKVPAHAVRRIQDREDVVVGAVQHGVALLARELVAGDGLLGQRAIVHA